MTSVDRILREMVERFDRLQDLDDKFGFLLNITELCYGDITDESTKSVCCNLAAAYQNDLDGEELCEEIVDCRSLLKSREERLTKPEDLLRFIVQYGDESVFPNLRVAIQLLLTVAISSVSCKRSFSKLKLILSCINGPEPS